MRLRVIILLFLVFAGVREVAAQTVPETSPKDSNTFIYVDEMPSFPGGLDALNKYLSLNTIYPQKPHDKQISGKVSVKFIVDKSGKIRDVTIIKSVDKELDAEAKRVIKSMPIWVPGKLKGEPVNVQMMLPINFKLD
jgi:TonB family protein